MHMGSLLTSSKYGKNNLKYILLNNNVHESVGNQITNSKDINFKLFSKSFKFKNYLKIKSDKNSKKIIKKFLKLKGSVFLEVLTNFKKEYKLTRPENLIKLKKDFQKKL